ncbi:armadillo repeat protein [Grosmannia clavigera kw1407]|uniref:Armadillo repeat protein n=1 Tax=Grosmannia clavigera (strain kw1407 / UAMH 11150) TaxID=655863 RepID=F0XTL5_GROCL|nr:armadillo repeat protein [Grosmannia clavigera kw1407]EFW98800.1 armadillo repeat protein [Grosmannia clavigera kw1407]
MVLIQSHPILERFRNARTPGDRIQALQALKNDTVGHVLKKSRWVELGVLRPVVRCVGLSRSASRHGDSHGRQDSSRRPSSATPPDSLSQVDLARLQALELLGVFASGGPSFLAPLHAAGALPAILSCIDPLTSHPRLVYAALRAMVTMSKAATLVNSSPLSAAPPPPLTVVTLADALFSNHHLGALHNIISAPQQQQHWWAESIANIAMGLIGPLCREERHQVALANAGILDDLAVKVASLVVARGQVIPGAEITAEKEGLREAIPEAASPRMDVAALLLAVTAIVGDSRLRACMMLYSPSILAIFPQIAFESSANDIYAAWNALCMGGLSNLHEQPLGALDLLLPAIPSQQSRAYFAQSSPFPPLGVSLSRDNLAALGLGGSTGKRSGSHSQPLPGWAVMSRESTSPLAPEWEAVEAESPMIPWLLGLVRSSSGMIRLAAASVLTSLFRAQLASKSREAAMALLVVPLLLRMLSDAATKGIGNGNGDDDNTVTEQRAITETALTVLARLVANKEVLQKAAVDCGATGILAKLLKESYEPSPSRSLLRPWNPTPAPSRTVTPDMASRGGKSDEDDDDDIDNEEDDNDARASKLGPVGQNALLAYRIRLRAATLKAIAALIASKYDYQKRFVEQEVMPYVVASLSPTPCKPRNAKEPMRVPKDGEAAAAGGGGADEEVDPEYGRNPVDVLVAACNCVRMLSRSIAILRVTLEDAGVAAPVLRLLRHPEIEVQNAATAVVCNLVTETSPMREQFAEADIMGILCGHAHSHNSSLRLNALWALKHFVDGVEPERKKACLEQLGSGWLVRLIAPGMEDEPSLFTWAKSGGSSSSSSSSNNNNNNHSSMDEDVVMDLPDVDDDNDEDDEDEDDEDGIEVAVAAATGAEVAGRAVSSSLYRARFPRMSHERSRTGRLRQAEAKLAMLREVELAQPRRHPNRSDDVEIQEQGLNLIRNLIGPGPSAGGSANDALRETTDMIDHLFSEIGQDRLFQILLSKLRTRVLHERGGSNMGSGTASTTGTTSTTNTTNTQARVLYPHTKIVEAVVFIMVHISASVPRHRQLVVAQTELLKALVAQFGSRNKGVRLALCHLLSNLTWREDAADTASVSLRTLELKRLGLLNQLQVLQEEDVELDVREQAKMAIHQMGRD